MKSLTKKQKERALQILDATSPDDLLWIYHAALNAFDKKKGEQNV